MEMFLGIFFSPSLSFSAFYIMKCFKIDNILA